MAKKKLCKIIVGTVRPGDSREFPLSRSGWTGALREARRIAEGPDKWLALVDLECPGGRIPMYQCSIGRVSTAGGVYKEHAVCGIESVGDPDHPTPPIAGRRKRK